MSKRFLTRRDFLAMGLTAGAGALASTAVGCAGPFRYGRVRKEPNRTFLALPRSKNDGHVVLGNYGSRDMRTICEQVIPQVTDLGWLAPGDSVFVKVSCNSDNLHPAVTSPEAVKALVSFLKDRGAGKIYVGDQAGVEHVRLTRTGRVSSTRETMGRNGLLEAIEASGATLHNFDDQGWDGYYRPEPDFDNHWEGALWVPRILEEVDHVIYLPRLGAHAVAGYTCGIKIAVGWMRDDSRLKLHQRGMTFFEKIAEINHIAPLRDRLRFTLTIGEAALLDVGPDIGGKYDFDGCMAVASKRLVDHDFLSTVLLPWFDDHEAGFYDIYSPYPRHINFWNKWLVGEFWGEEAKKFYQPILPFTLGQSMEFDFCVSHMAVLQRYRPEKIAVVKQGDGFPKGLLEHVRHAGGGIFDIV